MDPVVSSNPWLLITPGWKFHFFFIWPLKFPETKTCSSFINTHGNYMSYQLPCCLDFLWNSQFLRRYLNEALGTMDECLKPAASFLNWLIKKNQLQLQGQNKCVNFLACYTKCWKETNPLHLPLYFPQTYSLLLLASYHFCLCMFNIVLHDISYQCNHWLNKTLNCT